MDNNNTMRSDTEEDFLIQTTGNFQQPLQQKVFKLRYRYQVRFNNDVKKAIKEMAPYKELIHVLWWSP